MYTYIYREREITILTMLWMNNHNQFYTGTVDHCPCYVCWVYKLCDFGLKADRYALDGGIWPGVIASLFGHLIEQSQSQSVKPGQKPKEQGAEIPLNIHWNWGIVIGHLGPFGRVARRSCAAGIFQHSSNLLSQIHMLLCQIVSKHVKTKFSQDTFLPNL